MLFGHNLLPAVTGAGIVDEGEAEMRVLHLLGRVLAIPGIERNRALVAVGEGKGIWRPRSAESGRAGRRD